MGTSRHMWCTRNTHARVLGLPGKQPIDVEHTHTNTGLAYTLSHLPRLVAQGMHADKREHLSAPNTSYRCHAAVGAASCGRRQALGLLFPDQPTHWLQRQRYALYLLRFSLLRGVSHSGQKGQHRLLGSACDIGQSTYAESHGSVLQHQARRR